MEKVNKDNTEELIFFLGAGASIKAGLSDVFKLTNDFKLWLQSQDYKDELSTINQIIDIILEWKNNHGDKEPVDLEFLLETIERLERTFYDVLPQFFINNDLKIKDDNVKYLQNKLLSQLIRKFIQIKCYDIKTYDYYVPLNKFISNYKPIKIFTTNYDLIIELFCSRYKIKYSDRFEGSEWNVKGGNLTDYDLLLHKLHGSINWYRTEEGNYFKNLQKNLEVKIELSTGEDAVPLILYPGKKLEYIEPTLELLEILKNSLRIVNCCLIVGYAFKDDHISKLFRYSAKINKKLILFLIDPDAHRIYYDKLLVHNDQEFIHGFRYIGFTEGFNREIPTELENKVIRLPYKFEQIFPKLLMYHENLKRGLSYERIITQTSGMINPLVGFPTDNSLTSFITLIDCLECFLECEYFDKINEIIDQRTEGWDSLISEIAKVSHENQKLFIIYDILLKSLLNNWLGYEKQKFRNNFNKFVIITNKNLEITLHNNTVGLTLEIGQNKLDSYFGYNLYSFLERQCIEYTKITEINISEILKEIQVIKNRFERWQNGDMLLNEYIEIYVKDKPTVYLKIQELLNKLKSTTDQSEVESYNNKIKEIIIEIEGLK